MSTIDDIKHRLDITQVVSESVALHKAGRNLRGLCPFHAEKHGSFFVFPDRQSWHCFGACGAGGDVFSFVMRRDNLDFPGALKVLAEKAGVQLRSEERVDKGDRERERLLQVNEAAAAYYHQMLLSSPSGQAALKYLQGRGFSEETISGFGLGLSPVGGDALLRHLRDKGFNESDQLEAGVLVRGETGVTKDRFKGRLMFPIKDIKGRVVGFGGRATGNAQPKYLNSPQTPVFDKSGILFAIDRARVGIRRRDLAVVVEGYPDALMAHQHGFDNVVASMGTSLTDRQVGTLKKLTKRLVLALDADAAGEAATLRGIEVAARAFDDRVVPVPSARGLVVLENVLDAEISVAVLPEGRDPDEIILGNPSEWDKLVSAATPMVEYVFGVVRGRYDLGRAGDKTLVVRELGAIVEGIKDPIRRVHYLQKLAHMVNMDERVLEASIRRSGGQATSHGTGKRSIGDSTVRLSVGSPLEEHCLALLLHRADLRRYVNELAPEYFEHSENRESLSWVRGGAVGEEELSPMMREHLEKLRSRPIPNEHEEALKDCLLRLKERYLRKAKMQENLLIQQAIADGDSDELVRIRERESKSSASLHEVFVERSRWSRTKTRQEGM